MSLVEKGARLEKVVGMGRTDLGEWGVQQGETRLRAKVSLGERALCAKGRVGGTKRVPEILVPGRGGRLGGPRTWAHPVGSEPSVGLNKGAV